MNQNKQKPVKGVRIRWASFFMMVLSGFLFTIVLYSTYQVAVEAQNLTNITDEYIFCEENALRISDGSDYLTEQVRLYVLTGDISYADNYFTELYSTQRREQALAELSNIATSQVGLAYLQSAVDESDQLCQQEIYAIKLMAIFTQADMSQFPQVVRSVLISSSDMALSAEDKLDRAQDLVFNASYEDTKARIMENISSFITTITLQTTTNQQGASEQLERLTVMQSSGVVALFFLNVLTYALIVGLVTKPLRTFIQHIQRDEATDIRGSYECRYLAVTYNNMYYANASTKKLWRHRADHDPLTGLCNRGVFEQKRELLRNTTEPLAFLLVDVDQFKQVNDTFGHEVGDRVLKKVSLLLKGGFRTYDFVSRLGGDEFGIIMMKVTPENRRLIEQKINAFNQILQHDNQDDLPCVTLTVGVAFSQTGFYEGLFSQADQALYRRKENGRCGCQFYEAPTLAE